MYVCMYVCMYVRTCMHVCVCVFCMCVCMNVCLLACWLADSFFVLSGGGVFQGATLAYACDIPEACGGDEAKGRGLGVWEYRI